MTTRSQRVTEELRERLIEGFYAPGSRLNEVDLAGELGTSRTPVRAALNYLASEGLLVYRPNAGFMVRAFNAKYIAGVYEVRSSLEALAARLAAENGVSDEERGLLHRLVSEADDLIARGDESATEALNQINNQFHQAIIDASGNEHLGETLRRTRSLPGVDQIKTRAFDFAFIARAHEDHHHILLSILKGQGARAEALSQEHVHRGAQRILDYVHEQESRTAAAKPARPSRRTVAA